STRSLHDALPIFPSSFGTHVVLDRLSRPVGLTIPWWKRGTVPPGGSVIRDLSTVHDTVRSLGRWPSPLSSPVVQGSMTRRSSPSRGFQQVAKTLAAS